MKPPNNQQSKPVIDWLTTVAIAALAISLTVIFLASVFNPYGMIGDPAVGGLMAVVFGLSPLLWMMQWFRADSFIEQQGAPLEIQRQWAWGVAGVLVAFVYAFILGRTLYF